MNVGKSKLLVCGKRQKGECLNLRLKKELLEEVDAFRYRSDCEQEWRG